MMRACPACRRRHICGVNKKRPKKKDYGTKAIRAAVFKRANRLCEFCPWIPPRYAHELHHLEGGSGRRRERQSVSNCVALCLSCHREYHSDPWEFRGRVVAWADRTGCPLPPYFRREPPARLAELPR